MLHDSGGSIEAKGLLGLPAQVERQERRRLGGPLPVPEFGVGAEHGKWSTLPFQYGPFDAVSDRARIA